MYVIAEEDGEHPEHKGNDDDANEESSHARSLLGVVLRVVGGHSGYFVVVAMGSQQTKRNTY